MTYTRPLDNSRRTAAAKSATWAEAQPAAAAEREAAAQRATEAQVLEDAGRLIAAWNERQAKRTLMSPTRLC